MTLPFAFYGRVSTEDQQDPVASRAWQIRRAQQLIDQVGGVIIGEFEFFDIGHSRSLPWKRRPEALRLLTALCDPDRGFSDVVIGEPHRAFCGSQFAMTFPRFDHYGVRLWVPEVGGPIDPGSEAHDLVMSLYGGMSKGERTRVQTRVRSTMAALTATEGRFLGGRPPFGYWIADAGPHPNPAKAAHGQKLRILVVDQDAAIVVRRIFEEFIGGAGLHAIAIGLTFDGIPCPSVRDAARNSHRQDRDGSWEKSAVRAILINPRYTGHQVWKKQRKDEVLVDVDEVELGYNTVMRWNPREEWIWSEQIVHEPIVSLEIFNAAQAMFDAKKRAQHRTPKAGRAFQLSGLVRCGRCGRRMQGQWNHDTAYYRCKIRSSEASRFEGHPKSVYLREDALTVGIDRWVSKLFDAEHIEHTCTALGRSAVRDTETERRDAALRDRLKDCERRILRYRAALDQEGDITSVARWIAEVEQEKKLVTAQLVRDAPKPQLTDADVRRLVGSLGDIVNALASANVNDRAALYKALGISLTYQPDGKVAVEAMPRGVQVRVGGGT